MTNNANESSLAVEHELEARRLDAERVERAMERKDFDEWAKKARAARDENPGDWALVKTVRWAHEQVAGWEGLLAVHIENLNKNAFHTLSWSGEFVQATANNRVAQELMVMFETGSSKEEDGKRRHACAVPER